MRTLLLLAAIGVLMNSSAALAQRSEPSAFGIKSDTAPLGTRIKDDRVILRVPPERSYAELTSEQKARVKAVYHEMAPDDEPPYPVGGVKLLYTAISDAQKVALVEGQLLLVANVASDGKLVDVKVYKTPSEDLAKAISSFLLIQKFKPAVCAGKACAMEYPINLMLVVQ